MFSSSSPPANALSPHSSPLVQRLCASARPLSPSVRVMSPATSRIRDLQTRIHSLSDRLTSGIDSHHHHHHHAADPVNDQLVAVARRVEELTAGRERLTAVANKLAAMEHLLLAPDIGDSDPKVTQELLLLEEEVIREEGVYYEQIRRNEGLLDRNHLTDVVSEGSAVIADLTAVSEDQAERARQIREETDQLMQFNADLMKCMDDMLAEWDKKIRRIENK